MRKTFVWIIALMLLVTFAKVYSEDTMKEVVVKSSVQCEMCDEAIQKAFKKVSGVESVKVDLEKQEVTVKFDSDKTSEERIKRILTKIGYDADDEPADPKAYKKLPNCCKKPEDRK